MRRLPAPAVIGLCLVVIASGLIVGTWYVSRAHTPDGPGLKGLLWPSPKVVAPFSLVDQAGQAFTLERLNGKWSFVFFGFTHCADVCPMSLGVLSRVLKRLDQAPGAAADVQVVFVSVDPERDSPQQLASYLGTFSPAIVGATGSPQQVEAIAQQLGIAHMRASPPGDGNYAVDHSTPILLVDPRGRLVGIFPAPHDAEPILSQFLAIRSFVDAQS